ncbi:MAG: pyrroline-5-carboxylate reductase [Candidatus Omnitrophota bacterium]
MRQKIGMIGFGNMGSAITAILKAQKSKYEIWVFDKDRLRINNLFDIKAAENNVDLVSRADIIILAVKPQDFNIVLDEIKDYVQEKLIISIAAGIKTEYTEKSLGRVRVVRVMPNITAKVGAGITCLAKGKFAAEEDFNFAAELFANLGKTLRIEEKMMNAATAVSGSGPAYICEFIEAQSADIDNISEQKKQAFLDDFQKAAQAVGFNQEQAGVLVKNTFDGTIEMLKKTGFLPSELKAQVISKGGTTEAALEVLRKGGCLQDAVRAALTRAEELAKK